MNLKPKKIEVTPILSDPIEDLNTPIPKPINLEIDSEQRLKKCDPIEDLNTLKEKLIKLGIRFDTDPKLYSKKDYWLLICILYRALTHLYDIDVRALIVEEWLNPHSNKYIPTEKLVAEAIEELDGKIDQEILNRIQAIADEAALRLQKDQELSNSLNREVVRLEGLISQEENTRTSEITRVEGLISAEELARQQADTNLQNTKQDNLTAGDNISITNNVISAVDTIYDDTEVRGLIDAVDQKVDNLDEFTCGTITPTTTNFVEGTDYTVHEALQRTANLFEGYQGYIDDINELIPNQTTPSNQLADKAFVNSTVATNAANFRGNWTNFTAVPTSVNDYPADYSGSKTPTNNDYLVVQDGTDYDPANTGMWRFIYVGDWSTLGKSGWAPQYRVGSAFTAEQQAAIDSGITSTKVTKYEGYNSSIGALQTDKLDKVYTANKIYGTNNLGTQISYTAGSGISFNNGQINSTAFDDLFPLIAAGL